MEGSSQPIRMEEVDKLVNERVNEYIQNNLGQLLQDAKETERPSYKAMPPPPHQGETNKEEDVVVDGPPLTEDQIKAYEAWKTQSKGKALVVTNPIDEEKKVMMEEYDQITKKLQRLQTQVK